MTSSDTTTSFQYTTNEWTVTICLIVILAVNAIIAFSLLLIIFMRNRSLRPMFFCNVIMLLFTIAHSISAIIFQEDSMFSFVTPPVYMSEISLACATKIMVELILILRLRTLCPENNFLLIVCVFLVVFRAFLELFSQWEYLLYNTQTNYTWMYLIEPFIGAVNIIFFSSIFILTMISKMYIDRTIKALCHHRMFLFLILAIENMIVPCITSIILAIYTIYVVNTVMVIYRYIIFFIHLGVTVVSIILTTLLGSSSTIRHYSLE